MTRGRDGAFDFLGGGRTPRLGLVVLPATAQADDLQASVIERMAAVSCKLPPIATGRKDGNGSRADDRNTASLKPFLP